MTPQEILNTVCAGMKAQNSKSLNEIGGCAYRGANGSKCAVGILIQDDEYSAEMEVIGDVGAVADKGLLPDRLVPHIDLLVELQCAHDEMLTTEGYDYFKNQAMGIAKNRKLEMPEE